MNQNHLRRDIVASIVVFLIAIPLSLGIALASGAPVVSGLIAAAVGGIVAGALGGAPLQVSGPAAGMTVIVFGVVQKLGWPMACTATVLAGAIQILLSRLKIARMALAISPSVVYGMLGGIGVTIAVAQLQVILGDQPESSVLKNLASLPSAITATQIEALILGAMALAILFAWPKLPTSLQRVPAPLVAVLLPTVASVVLNLPVKRIELPADIVGSVVLPQLPSVSQWGVVVSCAITVALVASVESLLSAAATDKLHRGPRADLDRELLGQGAANALSGLLGGLPVTGVIVRSSANIQAGAQTRRSAILHGVWVLLFTLLLGSVLESIPLAVLAGLLVYTGIKLVNPAQIRSLSRHRELPVYLVTLAGVAGLDLITGVGIGLALSFYLVLKRMASTEVRVEYNAEETRVFVNGSLTFLNVPRLLHTLNTIPPGSRIEIELHTDFMDHAAFEAIHGWEAGYLRGGGQVAIHEPHEEWYGSAVRNAPKALKSPIFRRDSA